MKEGMGWRVEKERRGKVRREKEREGQEEVV
jgi:hypothetical protein